MTNLKKKLLEIQKLAQDMPLPPPPRFQGAPTRKTTPAANQPESPAALKPAGKSRFAPAPGTKPAPAPHTSTKLNQVREMQKAIQEFANSTVNYRKSKDPKKNNRGKVVLEKGKPVYDIDPSDSRRDFNDFLAENFSANADIHGDEYSANEADTTQESKMPTDIIQMNNVIDGLRRIGPGSKEAMSDGVWDFRTTNAVKNVYAFAAALVAASEALVMGGVANDSSMFKKTDLQKLGKAIPKEGATPEELTNSATIITPLVKKLTNFFDFYSKKVMNHPAYKRYIESDPDKNPNAPPLFSVKPGGVNPYKPDQNDPRQAEIMGNPKSFAMPQLTLKGKNGSSVNLDGKVTLDYLASREGLVNLMKNYLGYNDQEVNNGPLMRQIVNSILAQVNDFISTNSLLVKNPTPSKQPMRA